MKRPPAILLLILGVLVLMSCLGLFAAPLDIAGNLAIGWIMYLMRVLPRVRISWSGVAMAAACLTGTALLGHALARWLWSEMHRPDAAADPASADAAAADPDGVAPWRGRWTASILALVVIMFAAGIGATGVAHQTAWLARSEQPLFVMSGSRNANRIKCGSNLRQVGQALELHARERGGKLPETLAELLLTQDITREVFCCPSSDDEKAPGETPQQQAAAMARGRHCSYVYYGRGRTLPLPPGTPLAAEPLINHDGAGLNVLFASGEVKWLAPHEAERLLRATPFPSGG